MNNYEKENEFYKRALLHPVIGEPARKYLESRGINEETIRVWEIGYCPPGHKVYKKLKARITFPVRDQKGTIVTISGRKIFSAMDGVKYDMYPFTARKILFGLWQNKETIRDSNRAVITEGQFDVITAWQAGFKIATSTFGAHGTLWHLALLARYAKRIDVLYDADKAGIEGMEAIKKLSTLGDLDVKLKNPFTKGDDLDSWLQKNAVENLYNLLDNNEINSLKAKLQRIGRGI
jgi:DNA primase